ncbi:MAG TPA: zinc ribbon domain-containing protein [Pyrinomonadaceae bacterium]|nr:zinc ribbon domain-containing protein [Pyrinomonadaceae bacterium]
MENEQEMHLVGMALMSEDMGFKTDEMTACAGCGRLNSPNRLNCLYCGTEFDRSSIDTSRIKVSATELEDWEKGFNIMAAAASAEIDVSLLVEISRNTGIEPEMLRAIGRDTSALPVARVGTETEVQIIAANLGRAGIETTVVSDDSLDAENPPAKCRSMAFGENSLRFELYGKADDADVPFAGLRLIVLGAVFESKIEMTEKRKRGKSILLSESETTSDLPVFDIYCDGFPAGFRVFANAFDFSCLGPAKEYVAGVNLTALIEKLRQYAPDMIVESNYRRDRNLLDKVWHAEERSNSRGIQRAGLGKVSLANVVTRNNLLQFSKYSRLKRQFL